MKKLLYISFIIALFPAQSYAQGIADMNTWIESNLSSGDASIQAYLFLFLGGVLASLLPCTYPLYPITANVIKSRSQGRARLVHPLTYYLGLAFIYLIFGIVASLSGGAFNQILRLPLTNLIIGILIFVMGLSAMGLLHIPLFSGDGGDTKKKGLFGTFILGMAAGLLASSCVGPVVVSVLIGVASSAKEFALGSAILSALKMLFFGLGLGIPFLLIGVFGISLPKSGKWMQYVQYILGLLIIYFSYTYIEKGLSGYGFKPEEIQLVVFGGGLLLISVYFFQSSALLSFERMKRSLLILSAVVGGLILLRGMIHQNALSANVGTINVEGSNIEKKGELTWYLDKEEAYKVAQAKGKKVFVDFYANWCTNCKEFAKLAENDQALIASLKEAVLLKVYDSDPEFEAFKNDKRFPELHVGLPFFAITDKDGNLLYKTNDYLKTDEMAMFITD